MAPNHSGNHAQDEAARKRFADDLAGISKRAYPNGRVGPDDDGESAVAMAFDPVHDVIKVMFPVPTNWFALDYESAVHFRDMLGEQMKKMEVYKKR